jgi:hypothetical protein
MQISGNQIGHSFFSAYKLGAAPARPAQAGAETGFSAPAPATSQADDAVHKNSDEARDSLLLQSAQRSAGRVADMIEALPVFA